MPNPTAEHIARVLVGIISDGLNRSLGALEQAGAISTKKMRKRYTGIGSQYYDLVTEAIEQTANLAAPNLWFCWFSAQPHGARPEMSQLMQQLGIDRLNPAERLELLGQIWDSLVDDSLPLPDWHQRELEQRLAAADADSSAAVPWKVVRPRLADRS